MFHTVRDKIYRSIASGDIEIRILVTTPDGQPFLWGAVDQDGKIIYQFQAKEITTEGD